MAKYKKWRTTVKEMDALSFTPEAKSEDLMSILDTPHYIQENAEEPTPKRALTQKGLLAQQFIDALNIRSGHERILSHIIHYTYHIWHSQQKPSLPRISRTALLCRFGRSFKRFQDTRYRMYYWLDSTSFDLTKEFELEANEFYEGAVKTGRIK